MLHNFTLLAFSHVLRSDSCLPPIPDRHPCWLKTIAVRAALEVEWKNHAHDWQKWKVAAAQTDSLCTSQQPSSADHRLMRAGGGES